MAEHKPRTVLSVVLSRADMDTLDAESTAQERSRSNTARMALRLGLRQMETTRKAGAQ